MSSEQRIPPIIESMLSVLSSPSADRNHKDNVAQTLEAIARTCIADVGRYRREINKVDEAARRRSKRRGAA